MPSPFPGMDPFLERREIWPDFHDSLIIYLRETLQPLPKISIPLQAVDRDVIIDLQAIFNRCYDSGPYPQLLYYHQACPSKLSEVENSFVSKILKSR